MQEMWNRMVKRLLAIVYRDRQYLSKQDAIDAAVLAIAAGLVGIAIASYLLNGGG